MEEACPEDTADVLAEFSAARETASDSLALCEEADDPLLRKLSAV